MLRLGNKRITFSARLGVKRIGRGLSAGRAGLKHSGAIADKAEMVEGVANKVAGALGTGATLTALTGGGAPLAGALATAGGVVGGIGKVAGVVSRVERANQAINQL
jgi:hypothetical protein